MYISFEEYEERLIANDPHLTHISFEPSTIITNTGANVLANALKENTKLLLLDLSNVGLIDEAVYMIVEAIENHPTIQSVNLRLNIIEKKSCLALARLLIKSNTLTNLDISCANIEDKNMIIILKALRHNTSLKQLNVSCNKIGNRGAAILTKILRRNNQLLTLDISGNENIRPKAMKSMIHALKKNNTLIELNIFNIRLYEGELVAITKLPNINIKHFFA